MERLKQSRSHWPVLACLALVVVVWTWPLLSRMTVAVPGTASEHDVSALVWNVAWIRRALTGGGDLLYTDTLFLPFGADLRMHTYGMLQGVAAFPFTGLLGVVGALNLVLVMTLFLNGVALYALVYSQVEDRAAALVAAVWAMLGTPFLAMIKGGDAAFASIWIVAIALMALRRLLERPRPGNTIALGLSLLAALFSDFQIVFFSGLWLALYGVYWLAGGGWRRLDRRRVLGLGTAALIFLLPFAFIYLPALSASAAGDYPLPSLQAMTVYSFPAWLYVHPRLMYLAYGHELFVAAVVAPLLLRRRAGYGFWLVGAIFLLVLALGPLWPSTDVPLPFAAFSLWPPLRQFRTPARLAMPALVGLGVTAGYVLAHLRQHVRRPWLPGLLVAVGVSGRVVLALILHPFPTHTYPDYDFYRQVAAEPGDFALLEVPFGVRTGIQRIGTGGDVLQYYQHVHGKPILNAMIGRMPRSVFAFYRQHPSLLFLSGDMTVDPAGLDADLADVLAWSGAGYVLVHGDMLDEGQAAQIEAFLERNPQLAQTGTEKDLVIYRVVGHGKGTQIQGAGAGRMMWGTAVTRGDIFVFDRLL